MMSALILLTASLGTKAVAAESSVFESQASMKSTNEIDRLVFGRLERLKIAPANLCSDAVFVRRVFLDVIGTLPTPDEAAQFMTSAAPDKRGALIDQLLEREEFADYWAMKWSDLLRIKAEFPIDLWPNAAQGYHHWIRAALHDNMPYDKFARALLTASGSNFRDPPVNFYRAMQNRDPQGIAQTVALTFMGARADQWPKERLTGMSAFFSRVGYKYTGEWKEEIVFYDPDSTNVQHTAVFPDGKPARLYVDLDPREVFANWLIDNRNPWFAANAANRVWFWLLGRGITQEPDDSRTDNPPSNPELLAYLEHELVSAGYDLKHLYRLILNSKTYQLSSIPKSRRPEATANFAQYPIRQLDAEVLADALNHVTGTTEHYISIIPEPYTIVPEDVRSIALPDGSISSAFLEMFGRPPRDTGQASERNLKATASQRLHLLNSSHVQRKLQQSPTLQALIRDRTTPRQLDSAIYLLILSRNPTDEELSTVATWTQSTREQRNQAALDLAWALVNSTEFLYRH